MDKASVRAVVWMGVCWLAAGCAQAQEVYVSALGFGSVVPVGWTSLNQEEVRKNAKLFETALASMKGADPALLRQIEGEVRGGRIELLFAPVGDPKFRDNINVRTAMMGMPATDKALRLACEGLPAQLQQAFGRPMKVYACRLETLAVGKSLYLEFDGAGENLRGMQYSIPHGGGNSVWQVTGTFTNASAEKQRPVFEGFVRGITAGR